MQVEAGQNGWEEGLVVDAGDGQQMLMKRPGENRRRAGAYSKSSPTFAFSLVD
jgi:hypothetical protein